MGRGLGQSLGTVHYTPLMHHPKQTCRDDPKDAPEPRALQGLNEGKIVAVTQVGGLHHRYERLAA